MIPQTYVDLTDEQALKDLQRTLDLLDEDDDVTDVWTNFHHLSHYPFLPIFSIKLYKWIFVIESTN